MYGFLTKGLDVFMVSMKVNVGFLPSMGFPFIFGLDDVILRIPQEETSLEPYLEVILLLASSWTVTPMCKSHKFRPFGMGPTTPVI